VILKERNYRGGTDPKSFVACDLTLFVEGSLPMSMRIVSQPQPSVAYTIRRNYGLSAKVTTWVTGRIRPASCPQIATFRPQMTDKSSIDPPANAECLIGTGNLRSMGHSSYPVGTTFGSWEKSSSKPVNQKSK
jgi:hypothetical protein